MMIYKFNKMYYGGNIVSLNLNIPKDIKFVEYYRYNEKQQFIMFVTYYNDDLFKQLNNDNKSYNIHIKKLGNLIIGYLTNVQPLDELPYITIDELNNQYENDLNMIYIELYKHKNSDISFIIGELTNDEFKTSTPVENYKSTNILIESIHLQKFVKQCNDNGAPYIYCSTVNFHNWLYDEQVSNNITFQNQDILNINNHFPKEFEYKIYSNSSIQKDVFKAKERFYNRAKEIFYNI